MITRGQIQEAIIRMVQTNDNLQRLKLTLHSEAFRDIHNMPFLSYSQLVDLHWEVYHAIHD